MFFDLFRVLGQLGVWEGFLAKLPPKSGNRPPGPLPDPHPDPLPPDRFPGQFSVSGAIFRTFCKNPCPDPHFRLNIQFRA